jgi:2-succinyl-5-enolpyruvyl-6-hydroxy-3-cyclohexene-1-carboxylate synthase
VASAEAGNEAHLVGAWARLIFGTLERAGVRDVWVSPGSRSTPFVWAALETPGLCVRPVLDERVASFMALGQARATGRPSALLCTSGSAPAHYFPALLEAAAAHLPMLILSADRPFEAQHAGAVQTVDQLKLYGAHARAYFELGMPDAAAPALAGARRTLAQAVATTLTPVPGPVHVNLRARKPLEPASAREPPELELDRRVAELLQRPIREQLAPRTRAEPALIERFAARLLAARAPVIVAGPQSIAAVSAAPALGELSSWLGSPIFAEASSQLRYATSNHALSRPYFDWTLGSRNLRARTAPDLILQLGAMPTASSFELWALEHRPARLVLCEHGTPDALGDAELLLQAELSTTLESLTESVARALREPRPPSVLAEQLGLAERRLEPLLDAELSRQGELGMPEGALVRQALAALPDGADLMLGNSLPIRDADQYVARAARVRVLSQRGVSGIDGLVAGAIGSAVASGAPTLLLLGDVSLLHDLGALHETRKLSCPLVIAVIDNAGGRIFDHLPVKILYNSDEERAAFWRTPPRRELSELASFFELRYEAPQRLSDVGPAIELALSRDAVTLLHLRAIPESAETVRRRVLAALEAALV